MTNDNQDNTSGRRIVVHQGHMPKTGSLATVLGGKMPDGSDKYFHILCETWDDECWEVHADLETGLTTIALPDDTDNDDREAKITLDRDQLVEFRDTISALLRLLPCLDGVSNSHAVA